MRKMVSQVKYLPTIPLGLASDLSLSTTNIVFPFHWSSFHSSQHSSLFLNKCKNVEHHHLKLHSVNRSACDLCCEIFSQSEAAWPVSAEHHALVWNSWVETSFVAVWISCGAVFWCEGSEFSPPHVFCKRIHTELAWVDNNNSAAVWLPVHRQWEPVEGRSCLCLDRTGKVGIGSHCTECSSCPWCWFLRLSLGEDWRSIRLLL